MRHRSHLRPGDAGLAARLRRGIEGEVWFDAASRGRYGTDASIYQIEPIGVVAPRSAEDIARTIAICREAGAPVLPRGAGTSQCGQTVGEAVVVDTSKYLDRVLDFDEESRRVTVQPGIVLDRLNAWLRPKGLFFPVDVSPANRATIGGMAGNNSCGARSIRYGNMVHNVHAISAVLADGNAIRFGEVSGNLAGLASDDRCADTAGNDRYADLIRRLRALGAREADEIARRFPSLLRRVGGYNIDTLVPAGAAGGMTGTPAGGVAAGVIGGTNGVMAGREPGATTGAMAGTPAGGHNPVDARTIRAGGATTGAMAGGHNMAHLLVGSEGTLGFFTGIELDLAPLPAHRVLGICHFPAFYEAMAATQHIVALDPSAVELVDRTLVELARDIAAFRPTVERFVRGAPEALLLVEFAGEDRAALIARLARLGELMADLGHPGAVVEAVEPAFQRAVWEVRKAGLNIMMSMKGDGKPVSFVEDCAVRLEDLAEYTRRLDAIFARHGTRGTWYAHASVGTLHVRPIIDLKVEDGARRMRAIAEECFEMVREYRGSHSGEHGDGIVRSEFHEAMFGSRLVGAFEEVKDAFDPDGLFNPGKIVRPERMDDRGLFRYKPGYAPLPVETGLDWSEWGGFDRAVEMCNNNGACRKSDPGVMCPSYRVTKDERHVTRGRANTLRLALTGQLGPGALTSDAMAETMALCVGCKGCKRECPTGVDMARMKIEYLHQHRKRHGLRLRDRLVAWLPRYAPVASRLAWVVNLRDRVPGLAAATEALLGLSAKRSLPRWRGDPFRVDELTDGETRHGTHPRGIGPGGRCGEHQESGQRGRTSAETGAAHAAGIGAGPRVATRPEDGSPASRSDSGLEPDQTPAAHRERPEVALFADTFTTWFEPGNARAAARVLEAAGFRVRPAAPPPGERRPLCCGRTFLAAGLIDEARRELRRTFSALAPLVERGVPIVGLEPSCLLTFRDEALVLGFEREAGDARFLLFEELIADAAAPEAPEGRAGLPLRPLPATRALLHGHCHQKAFGVMPALERTLRFVPGLEVETVASSCCGMAGAFGYEAAHYETSMAMGELDLLSAVRAADPDTLIVAGGTSCRHQISDGTGRVASHVASVLAQALVPGDGPDEGRNGISRQLRWVEGSPGPQARCGSAGRA